MADRRLILGGVLATALVLVGGAFVMQRSAQADVFAGCRQGVVAGGTGALGTSFTLTDENDQRVTDAEVFAKPSLLYAGYTYCPDVCPLDGARNAEAVTQLEERGIDVTPVFLSVDPRRDTPEQLRDWTDGLHPRMLGLTGSPEEIAEVAKGWRFYYKLNDAEDQQDYLVDHMTTTYLVLPEHGTVDFFGREVTPEQMADTVACYVDAAN
ncbi:SCO family protein [Paracoccus sp. Z118]|uniref:SCO family protein n=1 Tax=Paracoccus sp. Z118 TaxID=2851017 RepID=UPI001C2C54EF|nr:SCO family protein [Paracoccus sp. Z118]MBV0891246.1 SCO family protein [Paracoccus sp. Z118]